MALAHNLATYDDLLALPEDDRSELFAGEVVAQPSPSFSHQVIQSALSHAIGGPFHYDRNGPGGWWIVPDVDVRFTPHDVVRPDHSGWLRARMPTPPVRRPVDVVPDWICEILSTSNARRDRGYKSDLYARHGVGHYWIVDPVERLLEAYDLHAGRWLRIGTYDQTMVARIAPFEAVEYILGGLLDQLDPATAEL
jgi:Uma2 family endonuclease